ncbi:MAG: hypothetical protein FWG91_06350 [Lachnospiraceae bacterium]|nr:hypothetical protein [Lachnospiraceae bacterium]
MEIIMKDSIFDDPNFIEQLNQDFGRIEAIAKAEKKSVNDVIMAERQIIIDNINIVLSKGEDSKKSLWREIYNYFSDIEKNDKIAEDFAENWGLGLSA